MTDQNLSTIPSIDARIVPFPWGLGEGIPMLRLRGSIDTTQRADALVAVLNQRLAGAHVGGTIVELDDPSTAASAALLVGINASEALTPVIWIGKPGDQFPLAGAPDNYLDISEAFRVRPLDVRRWADDLLALAQVSPRVQELRVETTELPTPEMLAAAMSFFGPDGGGVLVVPPHLFERAVHAIAASGYPWRARALDIGARMLADLERKIQLDDIEADVVREIAESPHLGLLEDDLPAVREAVARGVKAWRERLAENLGRTEP